MSKLLNVQFLKCAITCMYNMYTMYGMEWDALDPHIPIDEDNKKYLTEKNTILARMWNVTRSAVYKVLHKGH